MKYNTKIQTIPSNLIAGMFGFKPREYFQAEQGATEVPKVAVLNRLLHRACDRRSPPTEVLVVRTDRREQAQDVRAHRGFVVLLSSSASRVNFLLKAASIGVVIVAIIVIVVVGRVVLQQRQGRARDLHAKPADPAGVRALYNLVEGLCIASGLPKPRLYVIDDPAPNAFSTGRNPKHAAVAVTTGLLEKMNRVELEGVLAHELSHIRNYDILVMTLTVTMVGMIALLSDFFLRFMFWGGGRGGRNDDNNEQPARHRLRDLRVRVVDLRPDHRLRHAVRGQPQARVPRRRVGRAAHALPAGSDLGAREAEGRPHARSTPRRRPPRTCGSRSRSTRSEQGPDAVRTICSTPIRRSTTASTRLQAM